MSTIDVSIITPQGLYKQTQTSILNVETSDGARGILPNHVPVVTMLRSGVLNLEENGRRENYFCDGGLLYYRNNKAEILTDRVMHASEIDRAEAQKQAEECARKLETETDPAQIDLLKKQQRAAQMMTRTVDQQKG